MSHSYLLDKHYNMVEHMRSYDIFLDNSILDKYYYRKIILFSQKIFFNKYYKLENIFFGSDVIQIFGILGFFQIIWQQIYSRHYLIETHTLTIQKWNSTFRDQVSVVVRISHKDKTQILPQSSPLTLISSLFLCPLFSF